MNKWKELIYKSDLKPHIKKLLEKAVLYKLDFGDEERKVIDEKTKHLKAYLYFKKDDCPYNPFKAKYNTISGNTSLEIHLTSYKIKGSQTVYLFGSTQID